MRNPMAVFIFLRESGEREREGRREREREREREDRDLKRCRGDHELTDNTI